MYASLVPYVPAGPVLLDNLGLISFFDLFILKDHKKIIGYGR